ncbi:hypothetical protein ABBQ38_007071 [Trebouxia sp. C0009 RCD-2024]
MQSHLAGQQSSTLQHRTVLQVNLQVTAVHYGSPFWVGRPEQYPWSSLVVLAIMKEYYTQLLWRFLSTSGPLPRDTYQARVWLARAHI